MATLPLIANIICAQPLIIRTNLLKEKANKKTDSLFRFTTFVMLLVSNSSHIIVVTGKGRHSSPTGDDSKTGSATSMRRTSEKDKFGFYHSSAQPSNSSNSASSQKEDGKQDKSVTNTTVDYVETRFS